ncbi:putative ABC transporter ATP-binding protein/permease wht-1 [Hypsibius exemplaris]|uniref:ABC transporter ATP-binding protein/permease wht-1 n=1 Tax=Hypsibius exemplaris TaxID=2072580 RepID=A0A1W0WPI0_HYPEX|nr:putative ABC transporter ATP-binding protein/permease wht-1 [Hypsibius exemplaris]
MAAAAVVQRSPHHIVDIDEEDGEEAKFLPPSTNGHPERTTSSPRHEKSSVASSRYDMPEELIGMENLDSITLSWHNINVFLPPAQGGFCGLQKPPPELTQPKQILRNVNGLVRPGQLLAIMGASGAGKTTLLNMLNGRNQGNLKLDGTISINNRRIGKAITSISAYVQQVDLFVGTLTVREHLIFQSQLRMDKHFSFDDRMRRVEEVIAEIGLTKCSDTMIGIPAGLRAFPAGR